MKDWSGFYWPDNDWNGGPNITAEAMMFMGKFLAKVPGRTVVVQAGGNVGVYPLALSKVFQTVHTFEPEPDNYACLLLNMERRKTRGLVVPCNAALGEQIGTSGLTQNEIGNAGTFRLQGIGDVPVMTIDSLDLNECDLIWLDIEGSEVKALRGASETIDRHRPVVIVEDNGLTAEGEETGAAIEWLVQRGYRKTVKHGNDVLFTPTTKDS